jgi:hypothetical protein
MSLQTRLLAAVAATLFPSASAFALTAAEAAGEYTAVVDRGSFETSGHFRLVLGKAGKGTVAVRLGDEPPCVIGIGFGDNGGTIIGGYGDPIYIRGNDPAMIVRIEIIQGPDGGPFVIGQVEDDGNVYNVAAPKVAPDAGSAIGRHTFMFGSEAGVGNAGSGFAKVSANGRVTGAATVKGGRPVAFGGRLSPAQELPFAARFKGTGSSLVGKVAFGSPATTGNVSLHTQTLDQALLVGGTPYDSRQTALWNESGATSFPLGVDLDGVSAGSGTWIRGVIRGATMNGRPLRLSVNRATGVVNGRSGSHVLRGVAVQSLNRLGGLVDGVTRFEVYPGAGSAFAPALAGGIQKAGAGQLVLADNAAGVAVLNVQGNPNLGGVLRIGGAWQSAGSLQIAGGGVVAQNGLLGIPLGQLQFVPGQLLNVPVQQIGSLGGTLGQPVHLNTPPVQVNITPVQENVVPQNLQNIIVTPQTPTIVFQDASGAGYNSATLNLTSHPLTINYPSVILQAGSTMTIQSISGATATVKVGTVYSHDITSKIYSTVPQLSPGTYYVSQGADGAVTFVPCTADQPAPEGSTVVTRQ